MVPKKAVDRKPQFQIVVDNQVVNQKCIAQVTSEVRQMDTVR